MKWTKFILMIVAVIAVNAGAMELPALQMTKAEYPIIIDGRLDEPAWSQTPVYDDFKTMETNKSVERRTQVRMLYTDTAIIFGFKAYVPDDKIPLKEIKRDGTGITNECVEIMLDPTGGDDDYYHFIVSATNAQLDRKCEQGGYIGDISWNADFKSAVHRDKDFWSCEISIPYWVLEMRNSNTAFWKVNICRESGGELSSLGIKGRFNTSAAFRRLKAPSVDMKPFFWDINEPIIASRIKDGKLDVDIATKINNLTTASRQVTVTCSMLPPEGRRLLQKNVLNLFSQVDSEVKFLPMLLDKSGIYKCTISIRAQGTNRLLARREFSLPISFLPLSIRINDPHYRRAIFVTQKLDYVRYSIKLALNAKEIADAKMDSGVRVLGMIEPICSSTVSATPEMSFEFPVDKLPDGKLEIFAKLHDKTGKEMAVIVEPIRKLPYKKNEVWRGKDQNWYVDGEKIFLLAGWNYPGYHYPEYNVFMGTGESWEGMFFSGIGFGLAAIQAELNKGAATPNILNFFRDRVRKISNNPLLFGHYLVDEPDCKGSTREQFVKIAQAIADEDPYHPIVISTGSNGIINYPDCGEINGFHCYPNPAPGESMSNFMKIVVLMDKARDYFSNSNNPQQSIAYLHQGFNYGDVYKLNSRIPSYEEYRNQNILALILGSRGLLHYNRYVNEFPELYIGMPELVKEQKIIGENAIIQASPVDMPQGSAPELRLLGKVNGDDLWLLACNASYEPMDFDITWGQLNNRKIQVLSENRSISVNGGKFKDRFGPFEARVYTTSSHDFKLKSIKQINALIAADYEARRKPNNVAFQILENEKLTVNASSNIYASAGRPQSNALWHVTNGITADRKKGRYDKGVHVFCDTTPNVVPDWIELTFKKPVKINRVVVYPAENSLKNYEIQVMLKGEYQTVAKVENASGLAQESIFPVVTTNQVRVFVTANNGAYTQIHEIEVYQPSIEK